MIEGRSSPYLWLPGSAETTAENADDHFAQVDGEGHAGAQRDNGPQRAQERVGIFKNEIEIQIKRHFRTLLSLGFFYR
jgi:hypothetical protein